MLWRVEMDEVHYQSTRADIAAFSFYPTKNLGAIGGADLLLDKPRDLYLCSFRILLTANKRPQFVEKEVAKNKSSTL